MPGREVRTETLPFGVGVRQAEMRFLATHLLAVSLRKLLKLSETQLHWLVGIGQYQCDRIVGRVAPVSTCEAPHIFSGCWRKIATGMRVRGERRGTG